MHVHIQGQSLLTLQPLTDQSQPVFWGQPGLSVEAENSGQNSFTGRYMSWGSSLHKEHSACLHFWKTVKILGLVGL